MYNDEWEPVMTADSVEERIAEMANLARKRADSREKDIADVVHNMTHESYLMKHTTGDVLRELAELENLYTDAFHSGPANDHIMSCYEGLEGNKIDFWYDYVYAALAAGLEWAVLNELEAPPTAPG